MPELPEVQVFVDNLNKKNFKQNIKSAKIHLLKSLKNIDEQAILNAAIGYSIKKISRYSKYILFHLSSEQVILVHLRMSGSIYYLKTTDHFNKTKHLIMSLIFENDDVINLYDPRSFSTIHLVPAKSLFQSKPLAKLVPDCFQDNWSSDYFSEKIIKHQNWSMITFCLEQTICPGIGNIYANELLFKLKIHPLTKTKDVPTKAWKLFWPITKEMFQNSLNNAGTHIHSFDGGGNKANFQNFLLVYKQQGKECKVCKKIIIKEYYKQRGIYFCSKCQIKI